MPPASISPSTIPSSGKLIQLANAFDRLNKTESKNELETLAKSSRVLGFPDPLGTDLGVHDWLWRKREENYSAWLAWSLRQLTPTAALFALGLENPEGFQCESGFPTARCEVPVFSGHKGRPGRIDIVLSLAADMVVAIEVKMGSADDPSSDCPKQAGYVESLRRMYPKCKRRHVLIAVEGEQEEYFGFALRDWRSVALSLRSQVPQVRSAQGEIQAAMLLGFIGAVERNLLDLYGVRLTRYLEGFLRQANGNKSD